MNIPLNEEDKRLLKLMDDNPKEFFIEKMFYTIHSLAMKQMKN